VLLRGGHRAADPRLGRVPEFDDRSRDFPVRRLLALLAPSAAIVARTWRLDVRLDQANTPRCVGYAWTHDYAAEPQRHAAVNDALAVRWYDGAQRNDQYAGEAYEGSSTLGGAKAGVELGFFVEYVWCFGLDDLLLAVANLGPVVVGTNWYRRMTTPDEQGRVTLDGPLDGGHEWLVRGVDPRRERLTGSNSWGRGFGRRGDFTISFGDMGRLLGEDGDACYPVRVSRGRR
jgi:hypothetical protein